MSTDTVPSGSILVAYDGSEHSERALAWALEQAALEQRAVDLVHSLGPAETQTAAWAGAESLAVLDSLRGGAQAMVTDAVERSGRMAGVTVRGHVVEADPRVALERLSASAHSIVLGSRGRGSIRTLLLGSVSSALAAHAACPVVVVRPHQGGAAADSAPADGIVVAADGSLESLPVVEFAFHQAALHSLPLTVLHYYPEDVWGGPDPDRSELETMQQELAASTAELTSKYPEVPFTLRLERGTARHLLPGHDWNLVVVGRHDQSRWSRILSGSTAESVLKHARTTVAVVPEAAPDGEA